MPLQLRTTVSCPNLPHPLISSHSHPSTLCFGFCHTTHGTCSCHSHGCHSMPSPATGSPLFHAGASVPPFILRHLCSQRDNSPAPMSPTTSDSSSLSSSACFLQVSLRLYRPQFPLSTLPWGSALLLFCSPGFSQLHIHVKPWTPSHSDLHPLGRLWTLLKSKIKFGSSQNVPSPP